MLSMAQDPPHFGRPVGIQGPIGELARKVGSLVELARLLGTTTRTLRRWADGTHRPSYAAKLAINALAKKHKLAQPYPDHALALEIARRSARAAS
jgi:hypothetical protein